MTENKLYSVKEVSDLGLIWYKQSKIREFLKNWKLKGIQIIAGKRKLVKISMDSINKFMTENFSDYESDK